MSMDLKYREMRSHGEKFHSGSRELAKPAPPTTKNALLVTKPRFSISMWTYF